MTGNAIPNMAGVNAAYLRTSQFHMAEASDGKLSHIRNGVTPPEGGTAFDGAREYGEATTNSRFNRVVDDAHARAVNSRSSSLGAPKRSPEHALVLMESEGTHMARRTGLLPNRTPIGSFREGLKSCFYLRLRHKNGFVRYFLFAALRFTRAQYVVRSDASVLSRTSATQSLPCRAPETKGTIEVC